MEHLTKQQIVLLTLLVSFVTSIATGIVAVSLINQAPPSVTHTIDHIVQTTVEKVTSNDDTADASEPVTVTFEDQTADATAKVSQSVVRIKPAGGDASSVTGLGLVVSDSGVIVTDKSTISAAGNLVAVFSDGQEFPIQVIQSQINGDIVFVLALISADKKAGVTLAPVSFSSDVALGQTIFSLSGAATDTLNQGIISRIDDTASTTASTTVVADISTTIPSKDVLMGSPLFSISGDVIGIKTASLTSDEGSIFYPLNLLQPTIPVVSAPVSPNP